MQDAGKERILTGETKSLNQRPSIPLLQATTKKKLTGLRPVLLFLALSAVDVALNAAAGPAAVATGAHVNDSSSGGDGASGRALGIGAVSGATKAGILAFVGFLEFADIGVASRMLLIIVATVFGLSVLITAQVCSVVLGETPSELLKAALVAALPLQFESVGMYISSSHHREENKSGSLRTLSGTYIQIIGWDALGGYTFARMAENLGRPVCSPAAAAAAGGVYGVLSGIPKVVAYIAWSLFHGRDH
ncbi:hypothetical protein RB601_006174 [Gaeumannomyces tritici]